MIDFEFNETQLELQGSARRLFAEVGGLNLARRLLEEGGGHSADLWQRMAQLDWAGLTLPEAHGGSGGGLLDLFPIAMEAGRVVVTSPLITSSVVAGHILAAGAATSTAAAELLAAMATGSAIAAPAIVETDGLWEPAGIHTTLSGDAGSMRLDGTKVLVPFADSAAGLVVVARDGDGITAVLVDPSAAGVTIERVDNIAALPLCTVTFDAVAVDDGAVLGTRGQGWGTVAEAIARGAVLRCAEVTGASETMLDLAVDYSLNRRQFGKAIGSNQAVQYLCTDIGIEGHLTNLLARRAAWLLDTGQDADRAVAAAKLYASRAATHMAQQAHEVFAGLAFMMEHDLHLLTRHAKHWEYDLGDVRHHAEALVQALEAAGS